VQRGRHESTLDELASRHDRHLLLDEGVGAIEGLARVEVGLADDEVDLVPAEPTLALVEPCDRRLGDLG